jgi:hypothetical protein
MHIVKRCVSFCVCSEGTDLRLQQRVAVVAAHLSDANNVACAAALADTAAVREY